MAGSVLVIFILDDLTGDIRNRTMDSIRLSHSEKAIPNVQYCDPGLSDHVLEIATKEFNITIVPTWKNEDKNVTSLNSNTEDVVNDMSLENDFDIASVENYLLDTEKGSSDELRYYIAGNYVPIDVSSGSHKFENKDVNNQKDIKVIEDSNNNTINIVNNSKSTEEYNSTHTKGVKNSENILLESAPFLVAIFETLSNVTAHTCGGTLLSPHWVLTAASCVNLLGSVLQTNMTNNTNNADKSQYTVIANATNPLVDGSVHNVSQILFHPEITSADLPNLVKRLQCSRKHRRERSAGEVPSLALMRVEPGVAVQPLDIVEGTSEGTELRVFSWVLMKNDSGHDAMRAAWYRVRLDPAALCDPSTPSDPSALCLTAPDDTTPNITQISSGCPVLALTAGHARVLGVTQTDDRTPLAATSLADHAAWIKHVLTH